ncbi:MAG: EamA family transporter [Candidatus Krumholzibacteriota bacterium]|nr:EamA family transporter [Candidatus Krumholzibacteriota bacterium]
MEEKEKLSRRGLAHLSIVYLVWGSTYLAIRVAVREGSGFPPFTMALMRVIAASAILLLWALSRGERVRPSRSELGILAGSGILLWVGGNGLVSWAEMRVSSGLAALLVAAMPIWGACINCVVDKNLPGWKISGAILSGFIGVGVLSWPVLSRGTTADVLSVIALLLAPLAWATGSIWLQRRKLGLGDRAMSGWQQLLGGAGLLVFVILRGEPFPAPTAEAWAAWGYLVLLSSVICFTSYLTTLRLLPYQVVMTYAYVNPVIAVFLGWLILKEDVSWWTITGAALVVASVVGIFKNRK